MTIEAHTAEVESFMVHMSFRNFAGGIARHTISLRFKRNGEPLRSAYLHFISAYFPRSIFITGCKF